jgi:hypothetical protein
MNGKSETSLQKKRSLTQHKKYQLFSTRVIEQFIGSYTQAPQELGLDFDATDDLVHGK